MSSTGYDHHRRPRRRGVKGAFSSPSCATAHIRTPPADSASENSHPAVIVPADRYAPACGPACTPAGTPACASPDRVKAGRWRHAIPARVPASMAPGTVDGLSSLDMMMAA